MRSRNCWADFSLYKSPYFPCTDPQWRQTRRLPSSLGSLLTKAGTGAYLQEAFSQGFPSEDLHSCARVHPSRLLFPLPSWWLLSTPLGARCPWDWSLWCDECQALRTSREAACVLSGPFHLTNEVVDKHLSPEGQGNTQRQNQGY